MTRSKWFIVIGSFLVFFFASTVGGVMVKVNHMRQDDSQPLLDLFVTYATSWGLLGGAVGLLLGLFIVFSVRKN